MDLVFAVDASVALVGVEQLVLNAMLVYNVVCQHVLKEACTT